MKSEYLSSCFSCIRLRTEMTCPSRLLSWRQMQIHAIRTHNTEHISLFFDSYIPRLSQLYSSCYHDWRSRTNCFSSCYPFCSASYTSCALAVPLLGSSLLIQLSINKFETFFALVRTFSVHLPESEQFQHDVIRIYRSQHIQVLSVDDNELQNKR